jgi:hypothetical protein
MTSRSLLLRAAALAAAALLVACGDNPAGPPEPPPVAEDTVPASATASTTAYVQFVGGLPADDRAPPKRLDGVTPPTSETTEPLRVE